MNELRAKILEATKQGEFLRTIYEISLTNQSDLVELLVDMHNDGSVDLISEFMDLRSGMDVDFFPTQHLLQKALPRINAPTANDMGCALHLVQQAGQDMAAYSVFSPFIDFCSADSKRPKEALNQIEVAAGELVGLLVPIIIAGARLDTAAL